MAERVLIAGASGMIGTALAAQLRDAGAEVHTLVRGIARTTTEHAWDPASGRVPQEVIDRADAVVGLSGASLSRLPWTPGYRRTILRSRIDTTATLAAAITRSATPPRVWVNASAVGFYGRVPGDRPFDESSPQGEGFLAGVVGEWEDAARPASDATRLVFARTGVVLGPEGAVKPLALAARLGVGTTFGTGNQRWPWVALEDEARAIRHAIDTEAISGPMNIVAPAHDTAADVSRAIAAALHRPSWLRVPGPLAHTLLGTAADEMLLGDQPVAPRVLEQTGFRYAQPRLADAAARAVRRA
ncbi:hypothetical protein SAMN04489806_2104 [Paramicrobacterium humi]|uniref:TIGR01777 family protein n=1 Tax=Paramicrobacterium humi TaxID=640635 RepID=A0A1H4N779_9MICO|nr:TIGR01777 family oxidoreductase [Microbacterium humi]SEB91093.1 hypothetical protein SAMN04489806_2104 [Microbacterium humi]